VTRNPAIPGVRWSSKSSGKAVKLYPIYDWTFEDVWTFLGTEKISYNRIYDYQYVKGHNIPEMRVSSLIHENSHKCVADLQEFEPETYSALLRRVKGVQTAALYAKEKQVFRAVALPAAYSSWRDYRDFILKTLPDAVVSPFLKRFASQPQTESVFRQQVRQLMINDHENLVPVKHVEREDPRKKWMELL
jgi:predicted phosphoadenosine phosphosulfate sulfurtransferase